LCDRHQPMTADNWKLWRSKGRQSQACVACQTAWPCEVRQVLEIIGWLLHADRRARGVPASFAVVSGPAQAGAGTAHGLAPSGMLGTDHRPGPRPCFTTKEGAGCVVPSDQEA